MKRFRRFATSFSASFGTCKNRKSALLFPGQGSQLVGMGSEIFREFKIAKDVFDECDDELQFKLSSLMFEGPQESLTLTMNAQPAILCHSIAMLRVMEQEFGFETNGSAFLMGHSLGEYSALVAAKAISLREAIKLVRLRGQLMNDSIQDKETSMKAFMVLGGKIEKLIKFVPEIQSSLNGGEVVQIANINSNSQIVLSGTKLGVDTAAKLIQSEGLAGRSLPLPVSAPFHCSLMSDAAKGMEDSLNKTRFKETSVSVISNVTGEPFGAPEEIPKLLTRQIVETVQWKKSMDFAKANYVSDWLAVGPSKALGNIVKKEYPHDRTRSISVLKDLLDLNDY